MAVSRAQRGISDLVSDPSVAAVGRGVLWQESRKCGNAATLATQTQVVAVETVSFWMNRRGGSDRISW